MSLPVLVKTWQFNVNNTAGNTGSVSTDGQNLYLTIKNLLKSGVGTNPWQVRGSSNTVSAAPVGDLVDRWNSNGDVVVQNGSTNGAWIVLRQTGIATNFELLMWRNDPGGNHLTCNFYVSPSAGFTGGSTAARPTATDEINVFTQSLALGASASTFRLHYMQSTDGQNTRLVMCRSGQSQMVLILDKPANPTTGWTNPSISFVKQGVSNIGSYANLYNAANSFGRVSGATASFFMSCETVNGGALGTKQTFASDFDSNFPIIPIGLESTSTGARGRQGTMADLWYGSTVVPEGANYPQDATRTFIQFGALVFPWNGSVPQLL